jgi:hypothetical protein
MSKSKLPKNWDEARVKGVLEHYESQSDEEATAEDEAAYNATTSTSMDVPVDLVPKVRELIAKRKASWLPQRRLTNVAADERSL